MMRYAACLIVISFSLLINACREEMPALISGTVWDTVNGQTVERVLTAQQVEALSIWLRNHTAGWRYCLVTPPAFNGFSISVKHADGKSSFLRLVYSDESKATMMAVYFNGSNMSEQPCAFRDFSPADIRSLRSAVAMRS